MARDLISAQVLVEGAREERLGAHAEAHAATTVDGVYVPYALEDLCTARVAVTEWIDGVKLSTCEPHEIKRLTPVAQEAFLVQLLEAGIFHADPHPWKFVPEGRRPARHLRFRASGARAERGPGHDD